MMIERDQIWRHKENGRLYQVICEADLQCSSAREFEEMFEDDLFVVYRPCGSGSTTVRPSPEFLEKFELVK